MALRTIFMVQSGYRISFRSYQNEARHSVATEFTNTFPLQVHVYPHSFSVGMAAASIHPWSAME